MIDGFRRWAPIAVAIWALMAFIAWHYESACGFFFSGVCFSQYWAGLRWILLLKWIAPYQTLLGGLAAVAAGTFVLLAAKLSSEQAQTAENARRKQSAIVACSIVAGEFRDAQIQVSSGPFNFPKPPTPFAQSTTYIPLLHSIDPMLGSIVSAQKRDVQQHLDSSGGFDAYRAVQVTQAKCYLVWHLLLSISERLDAGGTYNLRSGKQLPAGQLKSLLNDLSVAPRSLTGVHFLFDWET
ncbi:hypothetical protein HFN60_07210 [Rhizobium leguminosarum]|uniref:hypothetical protein n=1 Tax=Rhizobium leguminosarum TaxID=384 RepID=UPI001C96D775|nr:hypothetical protein [Rhizobium leguminosarum]MBY5815439.1 hypothetical protein [Rhizobium leguminosarum]